MSTATVPAVRPERKPRARRVVKDDQVAHLWAHQAQEYATNPRRTFYFSGRTIWSYGNHFPIAKITDEKLDGRQLVLFTTKHYGNTTAGHCSSASQAITPQQIVLKVDNPLADSLNAHKANYKALVTDYENTLDKASRARSNREYLLEHAEAIRTRINTYKKLFLKKQASCPTIAKPKDWQKAIAKAADIRKAFEKSQAAAIAARKRKEEKARAAFVKHWLEVGLSAWKRGEAWTNLDGHSYYRAPYDAPVDFRLIEDGQTVETTRGAQFPKSHCERAFKAILRCREKKAEWRRNGAEVRVGHFQLDSIDPEGNVVAGCHEIKWEQIEAFAKEIGLLKS